ncbi:hypothetical protein [Algoriphagus pacificus]|uniref:Autotransporter translocation and assembly factor TamB n=1 Tax=Algoriphagus pacificus TaxID=2811234 RepID=A0ABS3CAI7_9BACT|nr:hypothetical protein [Algoriphagus pacificus]MBN7814115.1 hypothetical protein [Algoriphagus pacificus]
MSKEVHHTKSAHPIRKKLLKWGMVVFLALLFLEFIVYFGSNLLLSNWARRKINEATEEVYVVEFNRINFSLLRRGVFMDGIIMKPVDGIVAKPGQTLFDFSLDELAFKSLWYSFSDNIFYIGKLEFDNPNFNINLPEGQEGKKSDSLKVKKESPVKALEAEVKKSIEKMKINALVIREIAINHADLFFLNFLSENSLEAENTRLLIKDINLTTQAEWEAPFNARGFEFELEKVNFPLPDGVHSINSDKVFVSSLENQLDIKKFYLSPNKTKESKAYYTVELDELRVGNVDLNQAFMTSRVAIDEIVLNNPDIKVERMAETQKDSAATGDLNELIEGLLESISISELAINNGKFITSNAIDTLKNRIDIEGLDFKMIEFYLGDDEELKKNQFFYGEDASMEIRNASLYLSDEIHLIKGDKISVSSFKDEIDIENVVFEPREGALEERDPDHLIKIALPKVELTEANLKLLYNEGKFEMNTMKLNSPKVEIVELRKKEADSTSNLSAKALLEGYLSDVKIGYFDLDNGQIQFKNEAGQRSDDIGFESFSLALEDVFFQPNSSRNISEFLFAKNVELSLDKYRLKLRDNLHEFLADNVTIDSKNSLLSIRGLTIKPENESQVQQILDAYGKSVILDVHIPEFRAEGFNVQAAFEEERLEIRQILIPAPEISMTRFRKKKTQTNTSNLESSGEIGSLLTSYFKEIAIDSLSFSNGKIKYENFSGKDNIGFQEDNLSLKLKGFYVNENGLEEKERTFFSEEIDLRLENYAFNLAGGNYIATTSGLGYNSLDQTILIDNLQLNPGDNLESKIALSLDLPQVAFRGVDIESFLFENKLDLNKLRVMGGEINLEIDRNYKKDSSRTRSDGKKALPKSIELIKIDSIEAVNSTLGINFRSGTTGAQSIKTDFDLDIQGFLFDSASNTREDLSGLFSTINLSLQDFSFALPDSMHTLKFSNVDVDNTVDATTFSNFQIVPKNTKGSPGNPIVAATIKSVLIQNNTLKEIQDTGIFDLSKITLNEPEIEVYLDSVKKESKVKSAKPKKADGLIQSILLQDLAIKDGRIKLFNKVTGPIDRLAFEGINFQLDDLNLDLLGDTKNVNPQLLLEKDLSLSLTNYHLMSDDSLSQVKIGKIRYLGNDLILDDVVFGPAVGRYNYLNQQGFQADAIDAMVKTVKLEKIDFDTYFSTKKLKAKRLIFDSLELDVFRDKRLPLKEGVYKPMPQALLRSAAIDVEIDTVLVKDGIIRYQEFAPKAMLPGSIYFGDLNLAMTPFIMTKEGEEYPVMSTDLFATTKLMGEGDVVLNGKLFYEYPYPMDIEVEMGEFDLTSINNMVSRGVFVKVLEGKVTDGKWDFTVDDEIAQGKMNFHYEDLKIEFLDSLTLERGTGKLNLLTFLANTFTKNSNPRKFFNNTVTSKIYYERDQSKFIFGGWWRATFSGLKGALGLGQAKVPRRKEEEE